MLGAAEAGGESGSGPFVSAVSVNTLVRHTRPAAQ